MNEKEQRISELVAAIYQEVENGNIDQDDDDELGLLMEALTDEIQRSAAESAQGILHALIHISLSEKQP